MLFITIYDGIIYKIKTGNLSKNHSRYYFEKQEKK